MRSADSTEAWLHARTLASAIRPRRALTISTRSARYAGLYAIVAGVASFVVAPLLGLAYFATESGAEELEVSTVSAWADPARDAVGGLLTFASPDRVYATYLQAFALLTPAVLLCAWVVRSGRLPLLRTRLERWGWRIALVGYGFLSLGLVLAFVVVAFASGGALNVVFLAFIVPGIFLGTIGSTVLGIGLLRASYRPRLAAWLLAAAFPFWFFASDVLGHNSLGLLPIFAAWAVIGWRLWRADTREPEPLAG